ncbi:phage tail spike protein [Lacticaseibacillus suilingensis]|uniref:Phage tail spike protein n=1 Tax=Lacticaseibacillus suilingensis TaxID=2799577 RepID=A0ABW4BHV9_9LACO|nr:phage tail spike protein [Lacticaseibacillus suilingensis]
MDFYFTDRKFNTLGVASTGAAPIQIDADTDDQMRPQAVGRTYAATLVTDPKDAGKLATMAALGNFLLYKDQRGVYVFATIMEWTSYDQQNGELSFVAENGGVDLINETVGAYTATKAMPVADYINMFTSDSGFEIGVNEIANLTRTLKWEGEEDTALKRIESVATQFDNAELDFRFEVDGMQVIHRYIDIYKHMGLDNGQRLEVNTQLNKITTTGNIYDLCTSIKGTGAAASGSDTPINLVGYHWTDPDGRYVLGGDGVLRDTVAVQLWSRALSNDNPNPTAHHIQRVKSYEATTQAALLQSVLADLKQYNHAAVNYTVDIADLPDGVSVGDTVHLVDEAQGLNLSARLLELKDSYANDTHEATLGDYLIEASQIDPALQALADQMKTLAASRQWYPWTRYADDDEGSGISANPDGKSYMAIVWSDQSAVPSDDAADYAGHWQKVKGDDGVGLAGPKGDDGKTSYFHTAYANDVSGSGMSQSPEGKAYIGTYSDFTEDDSTTASYYTWVLIKGADGATGPAGKDITSYASGAALPTTVAPANSQFWVTNSNNVATALYKSNGTAWVKQEISASAINAATFNGLTFNGVIFNGSQFNSTFTSKPVDESSFDDIDDPIGQAMLTKGTGTTKMGDGYLTVDGTIDGGGTNGTPLQSFHTEVGASGLLSRLYTGGTDYSHVTAEARLNLGELSLTNLDTAGKARSGHLNGELLEQLNNVGKILWSGTSYLGYKGDPQSVKPSMKISDCLTGWKLVFGAFANNQFSGNQLREADVSKTSVAAYPGMGRVIGLIDYNMQVAYKYIYVTDGEIKGNENNADGVKGQVVLIAIYAY